MPVSADYPPRIQSHSGHSVSKYELARRGLSNLIEHAEQDRIAREEILETLVVVTVEALAKSLGRERTADILRYELSNIGGAVDTVFLRSR